MAEKKYWFLRRRFGWGWVPVTWQGWLTIVLYLVIVLGGAFALEETPEDSFTREIGFYLLMVAIASGALFMISYRHGPKPKWRWGAAPDDKPDEDY